MVMLGNLPVKVLTSRHLLLSPLSLPLLVLFPSPARTRTARHGGHRRPSSSK